MNLTFLILLIVYEVVSVVLIYRLWTGKRRPGLVERCLLSIVLLVPFAGWFLYLFLKSSPGQHGENPSDYSGGSSGVGDGGGWH
jgi:hypothetical protein